MSSSKLRRELAKQAHTYRVAPEVTSDALKHFLLALDCPRSLTVWLLFANNEHRQLVDLECSPLAYRNGCEFADAYAATELLKKAEFLQLDGDKQQLALEKFSQFEELCKHTNNRFRNLADDPLFNGSSVALHEAVRHKISQILGPIRSKDLIELPNWGPGASTLIKSRWASAANKFQLETGITRDLYHFLEISHYWDEYPMWRDHLKETGFPVFFKGNKVITVAKNAKIDRVIAIEPGLNIWFQKAIGSIIRKRLYRCGLDLAYQSQNQSLARLASESGQLATIDFSSASDSISTGVVESLLPTSWYHLLNLSRSHFGELNGTTRSWNKFSSMGNGFTFELESLIFYAVSLCCCEYLRLDTENVSVYGDDVIIPVDAVQLFTQMSTFYGFKVNLEKSFSSGPFRESCGKHYFWGMDVSPFYLRKKVTKTLAVYRLANAIRRYSHRRGFFLYCEKRFRIAHSFLVRSVPRSLRIKIPETLGDGGFISNFDEATPDRARHWIEGFICQNLIERSYPLVFDGVGLLLARLWKASMEEFGNSQTLRGRTRLSVTRSLVGQWYDLGPWL